MMTHKKNLENDCSGLTLDDLRSEVENTEVKISLNLRSKNSTYGYNKSVC